MRRDVRARALGPVRGAGSIGPCGDESGSGTILVVALLATATACALVLAIGGSILAARARLDAVADLAALAGADVSATSAWEATSMPAVRGLTSMTISVMPRSRRNAQPAR